MKIVNMHEAKTHLSRLVEAAAQGEPFIIARSGKPLVEVRAVAPEHPTSGRIGFLRGQIGPLADVKEVGRTEIDEMFDLRDRPGQ